VALISRVLRLRRVSKHRGECGIIRRKLCIEDSAQQIRRIGQRLVWVHLSTPLNACLRQSDASRWGDFRKQCARQKFRKVSLPARLTVAKLRSKRGVSPQPVGSNELVLMNPRGDRFGTPLALARDSEGRAQSKVCTFAGSANRRPRHSVMAETFGWRGAAVTRWSSSPVAPDYNVLVKIGTRQTLATLVCVAPVLAGYTYFWISHSTQIYIEDLKRETRATTRALQAALEVDIAEGDWKSVRNAFVRIRGDSVEAALLDSSGNIKFSLSDFPVNPPPKIPALDKVLRGNPAEFMQSRGSLHWFCRAAPMVENGQVSGVLLVAQDWSDVHEDLRQRVVASALAGAVALTLIALLIPLVSRRYISRPLAELSRRLSLFSADAEIHLDVHGNEVELLTEEFRRLYEQLTEAQQRLRDENVRKIDLERRLRHSDKLATIGTLASGLAHEIGTPLNVIRGRAEYLLNADSNPLKSTEGLETIVSQIDRITKIVRMLLDFSSRRELAQHPRDVREIINATLNFLQTEAERRGVRFVANLPGEPLIVKCEAGQLQQVFINLAVNALDAMSEEGGTLQVTAESERDGMRRNLRLLFEDSGPGVAESDRERIFDPFFTTKEPGKGTGMGLAISQSIIREHDGKIEVERGRTGACFVVTLPLVTDREIPTKCDD
jgi:two-component system, NtrC family, sensor kinase